MKRGTAGPVRSMRRRPGLRVVAPIALLATGASAQTPILAFEGLAPGDAAGSALARLGDLDGDGVADLVVGAPESDPAGPSSGAAYVVSGLDASILFVLNGHGAGDQFGAAVASAGDVDADGIDDVLIGAPQDVDAEGGWGGDGPGYVQVFSGADGSLLHTWQGEHGLNIEFDSFGRSVAGAGDLDGDGQADVVVGEREGEVELLHDLDTVGGRVWAFSGREGTVLRRIENVGTVNSHLGWSVAGGTDFDADGTPDLIAGAPISGPDLARHAVVLSGATSSPLLELTTSDHMFGFSVAFLGDVDEDGVAEIGVGSRSYGAIYSGASGQLLGKSPDNTASYPYDGNRVAALDDVNGDGLPELGVGAPDASGGLGRVLVLSGANSEIVFLLKGTQPGGRLGSALAGVADMDRDGFPDLVAGAYGANGPAGAGAGSAGWFSTHAPQLPLTIYSPNAVDIDFGQHVASVGDANNDGFGDIAVGLPFDKTAGPNAGRMQVFSGYDGSLLIDVLGEAEDRLGFAVVGAGDVNADGFDDILAGAPYAPVIAGPAYVRFYSGRDGSILLQLDGHANNDRFGLGLASLGDLDQDGHDDVAVAAPTEPAGPSLWGKVYAYSGRSGAELWQVPGTSVQGGFGAALAPAGDVDGDGFTDVIAGAPTATAQGTASGLARVYSGATGALLFQVSGDSSGDQAGTAVAGVGDVDGDGHDDVAVGIPYGPGGGGDYGSVRVVSGVDGSVLYQILSSAGDAPFGLSLAGAGDVDGDGVPDLAVGVPWADDVATDAGVVRVYSGADGTSPFSWPGTSSGNLTGFALSSRGDVDNDGSIDLVVGSYSSSEDPAPAGKVNVVNPAPVTTPWMSLGGKLPGTHGAPVLVGSGPLEAGTTTTLTLTHALENSVSTLVLGLATLGQPFKGGTLVPSPDVLVVGLATGAAGSIELSGSWPAGLPAELEVVAQHWVVDPAAVSGLAASNAVEGSAP